MFDVPALRRARATEPLRQYEAFLPEDREERAAGIVSEGWKLAQHPPVDLTPPLAWDEVCASNRSWHYHLHCWSGLGSLLASYSATRDDEHFHLALGVALDWARSFPSLDSPSPFAWYDMATGLRAYRLGYLVDAALRIDTIRDEDIAVLLTSAALHATALADDRRFSAHSNHGFYQALGQLALGARLPDVRGMEEARSQAAERLRQLIEIQFTEDGVHREHSPGYHLLVFEAFDRMLESGLLDDGWFRARRKAMPEALAWFVLPNGRFAMFGDTGHVFAPQLAHTEDPELRFVMTRGRGGRAPAETARAFPEAGYVVMRDRWPDGEDDFSDCSYLAQIAGFHSRTHKHADDLSFVWYDRGQELLTDSGRYGFLGRTKPGTDLWDLGFNYADPKRVYVESTRAHNTVEIDATSHRRRAVEPYGSALRQSGRRGEIQFSEAEVAYPGGVRHLRVLLFRPRSWLVVLDRLVDSRKHPHHLSQRFHFAPELEATRVGDAVRVEVPGSDPLFMTSLTGAALDDPVRGQEEPELLGWVSRTGGSLMPAWTAAWQAHDVADHTFVTLFCFGAAAPVAVPGETRISASAQHALLTWRNRERTQQVGFSRVTGKKFRITEREL